MPPDSDSINLSRLPSHSNRTASHSQTRPINSQLHGSTTSRGKQGYFNLT